MAEIVYTNNMLTLPVRREDEPMLDDWIRCMQLDEPQLYRNAQLSNQKSDDVHIYNTLGFVSEDVPSMPLHSFQGPSSSFATIPTVHDQGVTMNHSVVPSALHSFDPGTMWPQPHDDNQAGVIKDESNLTFFDMDFDFAHDEAAILYPNGFEDPVAESTPTIPQDMPAQAAQGKRIRFTEQQTAVLEGWLDAHISYPYPTPEEMDQLAEVTHLDVRKVRNWFTRARQRKLAVPAPTTDAVEENDGITAISSLASHAGSSMADQSEGLSLRVTVASSRHSLLGSSTSLPLASPSDADPTPTLVEHTFGEWEGSKVEWWLTSLCDEPQPKTSLSEQYFNMANAFLESSNTSHLPDENELGLVPSISHQPTLMGTIMDQDKRSSYHSDLFESFIAAATAAHRKSEMEISDDEGTEGTWQAESDALTTPQLELAEESARSTKQNAYRRRSRLSDDSRSVLSNHSADSKPHSFSACSYTSYGSRKGRRRPRAVETGPKSMYTKYQSFEGQVPIRVPVHRSAPLEPLPEGHASDLSFGGQPKYQCAYCNKIFTRKSTCKRHEKATHAPENVWICCPNPHDDNRGCFFCRFSMVPPNAGCQHDMRSCYDRNERDRTFYRKDNFKQHLMGVHKVAELHLRSIDLSAWEEKVESSALAERTCPLCGLVEATKGAKLEHLARHYETYEALGRNSQHRESSGVVAGDLNSNIEDISNSALANRTCEICGSVEASVAAKADHMMRVHEEEMKAVLNAGNGKGKGKNRAVSGNNGAGNGMSATVRSETALALSKVQKGQSIKKSLKSALKKLPAIPELIR